MVMSIQVRKHEASRAPGMVPGQPSLAANPAVPGGQRSAGSTEVPVPSWQDLASKMNTQVAEEGAGGHPGEPQVAPRAGQRGQRGSPHPPSPRRAAEREDEEELEMDAGVIDREMHSQQEPVVQEPMMPDDAADPAQDPNNQGEDEFEEAELERPDFEEKVGGSEKLKEPNFKEDLKEKPSKDAGRPAKPREDPLEDYQEDQEQEIEDHGGEVDDNDDLELVQEQKDHVGRQGGKKDDYF